jgi:hypothetical protein
MSSGQIDIPQPAKRLWDYTTDVVGPISVTGGAVTKYAGTSVQLDVVGGEFYAHNMGKVFDASASPASFTYWYRAVSGGWTAVVSQTSIDTNYYDNGSGTLASLPSGKYKRDLMFVATNNTGTEYHVVYGQEYWDDAVSSVNNPTPPPFLLDSSCRLAAFVVLKAATDIATVIDQRPKLGQLASGSSGVTKHGDLSGLAANDHTQYQLRTEKDAANGYAGLSAASKIASSAMPTHASTHQTSGSDTVDHNSLVNYSANRHIDHTAVSISTSGGLQGGGDISATRTISPVYGTGTGTVCQGNDSRLSDARTPTAHATSHKSAGGDSIKLDELAACTDVTTLNVSTAAHGLTPKLPNDGTKYLDGVGTWTIPAGGTDVNAIHKNVAAEISTVIAKTALAYADLMLLEDSADSNVKKSATLENILPKFGRDYQTAVSLARSTTTSQTPQTKVTLTTGALTGTYRIGWCAAVDAAQEKLVHARLYNNTDAALVGVDKVAYSHRAACVWSVGGFAEVTFSGSAKTFYLQYASNAGDTVGIADARIELWRVS